MMLHETVLKDGLHKEITRADSDATCRKQEKESSGLIHNNKPLV